MAKSYIQNTFTPSTPIGQSISNFLLAYGNTKPTKDDEAKSAYLQSQTDLNKQKLDAPQTIQDLFSRVYNAPDTKTTSMEGPRLDPAIQGPMPVTTKTEPVDKALLLQQAFPELAGAMVRADQTGQVGNLFRAAVLSRPGAPSGPNADTSADDRAMLGAGDSYTSTMGGFREKQAADLVKSQDVVKAATVKVDAKKKAADDKLMQGKQAFETVLGDLTGLYTKLKDKGAAVTSTNDPLTNAMNYAANTERPEGIAGYVIPGGQTFGRMFGTENQDVRNQIAAKIPLLSAALKNATGMSSQQLNSNFELQQYLRALSSPTNQYESNVEILKGLSKQFGTGSLSGGETATSAPTAPAKADLSKLTDEQLQELYKKHSTGGR